MNVYRFKKYSTLNCTPAVELKGFFTLIIFSFVKYNTLLLTFTYNSDLGWEGIHGIFIYDLCCKRKTSIFCDTVVKFQLIVQGISFHASFKKNSKMFLQGRE